MLTRKFIDGLYTEAMLLADEARSYFDDSSRSPRADMSPLDRVVFSCESLKVTTRLMHIIAWLLTQRAIQAGEMGVSGIAPLEARLGPEVVSDPAATDRMPDDAQALIGSSIGLFRRIERLDQGLYDAGEAESPARSLQHRLESTF